MIPYCLQKGDTIGLIAPSSPITEEDASVINDSICLMEQAGFSIVFAKNALQNTLGYSATAKEKAEDILEMFCNPNIKAIFCVSGGFNCNSVFDYLDYKQIAMHPKIICGFSDPTSLLNILHEKTGLVTFHGATFKSLTSWATDYGYQQVIKRFCEKSLSLAEEDDTFTTIANGIGEGSLIGGNLSCISQLICGKYAVDFTDKILFLEEFSLESPPASVSHNLYYLKQNGVFSKIKGLWIGNYDGSRALEQLVLDVLEEDYSFPIIKSNNFGHTEKKMVIPIGAKARIDTTKEKKIELIENCVQ